MTPAQSANIFPAARADGTPYAVGTPLTAQEADLFNQTARDNLDPVAVDYNESISAVVQLTAQGALTTNSSYVVMQTDLNGDGVWIDMAWCVWTGISGTAVFYLSGGVAGANSFQQSRAAGSAPASNGSNQCQMGGRIRFVGKATTGQSSSSSSSSSGTPAVVPGVVCTIKYKQKGVR